MKAQNIIAFFFALAAPFLLNAQVTQEKASAPQTSAIARQNPPPDPANIQMGDIEEFRYQLLRLESAMEDKDQTTIDIEKNILLDAMNKQIKQAANIPGEQAWKALYLRQKAIYEALKKETYIANKIQTADVWEKTKPYSVFAELMVQQYEVLEKDKK